LEYSNPLPKEGINTSQTSPLKELLLLTSGLLILLVLGIMLLSQVTNKLAHYIPFTAEVSLTFTVLPDLAEQDSDMQIYLQSLADQLAKAQNLPVDISVTIHYIDTDTVNAMATLAGHIFIFRGLLEKLGSENALAMVLAHEVSHIHHRHPIQTLGRNAVITLALSSIGFATADAGNIIGSAGLLTALSFSREQEQTADFTALLSLEKYYGHVNGATDLFRILHKEQQLAPNITFLRSHPLDEDRIKSIKANILKHGWGMTGSLTPFPQHIQQYLTAHQG